MTRELKSWIDGMPGPFSARTPDGVLDLAWRNFNEGVTGQLTSQLHFIFQLSRAGYDALPTGLGGFVLRSTCTQRHR